MPAGQRKDCMHTATSEIAPIEIGNIKKYRTIDGGLI